MVEIIVRAMQWSGDEPISGPERVFVRQMILRAMLDAIAIAERNADYFQHIESEKHRKSARWLRMKAIERVTMNLHQWLECDQFAWYCELLHWDTDGVRASILKTSMGVGITDAHRQLRKSEKAPCVSNNPNMLPMRVPEDDNRGV